MEVELWMDSTLARKWMEASAAGRTGLVRMESLRRSISKRLWRSLAVRVYLGVYCMVVL